VSELFYAVLYNAESAAAWWMHAQHRPSAYASVSVSSRSIVHSYRVLVFRQWDVKLHSLTYPLPHILNPFIVWNQRHR